MIGALKAMAHGFIKDGTDLFGNSRLLLLSFLPGTVLLVESFIVELFFPDSRMYEPVAMVAALFSGVPLIYCALGDLLYNKIEMNELAAVSFTALFCTGRYRAAALIALFVMFSNIMEHRSMAGAKKNIEELMRLSGRKVRVMRKKTFVELDAKDLRQEDVVLVVGGDIIPADGIVIDGEGNVDESALTGEPLPVYKTLQSNVYGGTINISGRLVVRIKSNYSDSTMSKIRDLILNAEKGKIAVMRLIDRYAGRYTPAMLLAAGVVYFFTRDVDRTVSLLVVSCPCMILLSAPSALITALGAASRMGVVITEVSVLEKAGIVDTVIFDKTGTLTEGVLSLASVQSFNSIPVEELLKSAGSLEQYSNHPAAKAICKECRQRDIKVKEVKEFREIPGKGVAGIVDDACVVTGCSEWVREQCFNSVFFESTKNDNGEYLLHLSANGVHEGCFYFVDTLRKDAKKTAETLGATYDKKVIMMTGDRESSAQKVASELGCDFEARVTPEQKMERIKGLQKSGHMVAMVGDGINDAPALAAADLSIAMGTKGSDIAVNLASIVIMGDSLEKIPYVFDLSNRTTRVIKQNITFSVLYTVLMTVLGAAGGIIPVVAAILHAAGIAVVIVNSGRLVKRSKCDNAIQKQRS